MNDEGIVVLVPALNAGRSLPMLVSALRLHLALEQILVVDDGSSDETPEVLAAAGVMSQRHPVTRGKGAALRTGFEWWRARGGWRALVTMDADLQHRPEDLSTFVERWKRGGCDIVAGKRGRLGTGMPLTRVLSNTITSALVSARCSSPLVDTQCGYRLLSREVVEAVRFDSNGFEAETEILIRALLMGFTVESVGVRTVYGNEESHMTPWHTTKQFIDVLFRDY